MTTEEKFAIVIDGVPDSNHTIDGQGQFEAAFDLSELDGDDLQGLRDDTIA